MLQNMDYTFKSTLDQTQQSLVDSILKDLKICSRRLQTAFHSQQVDLQVLERLYYKGNNQHRSALFWRRIEEIRRYTPRLTDQRTQTVVDELRLSFWGPVNERTSKSLKGAWTHVPNPSSVQSVLDRLVLVHRLITKMHGSLSRTYRHLNLNFQTGAFLQLILTLSAITARLATLSDELLSSIEVTWNACHRLLCLLDPEKAKKLRPLAKDRHRDNSAVSSRRVQESARSGASVSLVADVFEDDVGSSITRTSLHTQVAKEQSPPRPISSEGPIHNDDEVVEIETSIDLSLEHRKQNILQVNAAGVVRKTINRDSTQYSESISTGPSKHKRSQLSQTDSKKPDKKSKKKRDEIDDIFGF
ncbi:unnamed protein product [Somion occarium]|uniref:Nucleolus and neural progenitor protein-like N-terminal domain-containing protein n=1 Tax=Somion occarium TaxID=3059160 RepID=A0ABP1DCK5_9APHY